MITRSYLINTSVTAAAFAESASSALSRVLDGLKGHLRARSGGFLASSPNSSPSRRSIYEIASSHLKTTSAVSAITRNRPLSAISRIRHGLKSRVRFGCLRPSLVYKLPGVTARSLSCLSLALVCLFISGCFFVRVPVHEEQQRAHLLIDQGVLLLRQGDFERAEAAFQLSLDLNPGAAALDGLGCVALLRGDAEGAKRHFNAALEADFRYTHALGNMALLYEQIGDRLRAREYYEQAIERDPGNFRFRNNYAIFLAQNGNGSDQMVRQQLLQAVMLEDLPLISTNLQRVSERKE